MIRAIVILYNGGEPSQSTISDIAKIMSRHTSYDSMAIRVVDRDAIADDLAAKTVIPKDWKEQMALATLPGDQAITLIGGLFSEQLRIHKEHPSLFVSNLLHKYNNTGDDTTDEALRNALKILSDPHVEYSTNVAQKWKFTKSVHRAIIDIYPTLTR